MANAASKLEPYRDFIATERRKKTTYRRIAELLAEKGIEVDYTTIFSFVKVRSKPTRRVITMLEPSAANAIAPPPHSDTVQSPRVDKVPFGTSEQTGQLDAIQRLKAKKPGTARAGKGLPSFNADEPLERLTDDEARRQREQL